MPRSAAAHPVRSRARRWLVRGLVAGAGAGVGTLLAIGTAGSAAASDDPLGLGGLLAPVTGTVQQVVEPIVTPVVQDVVKPVLDPVVQQVVAPVAKPVAPVVEAVAAPVAAPVAPVVKPVADVVAPVTGGVAQVAAPVAKPVVDAVAPAVTPVLDTLAPVTGPVADSLAPVVAPILEPLAPVLNPVLDPLAPVVGALDPVLGSVLDPLAPVVEPILPGTVPGGGDEEAPGGTAPGKGVDDVGAVPDGAPRPAPDVVPGPDGGATVPDVASPVLGAEALAATAPSRLGDEAPLGSLASASDTSSAVLTSPVRQPLGSPLSAPGGVESAAPSGGSSTVSPRGGSGGDSALGAASPFFAPSALWALPDAEARAAHTSTFFEVPVSPA